MFSSSEEEEIYSDDEIVNYIDRSPSPPPRTDRQRFYWKIFICYLLYKYICRFIL